MSDDGPVIEAVIAEMAADDPDAARDVEAALEWLTAGEGLEVLTQDRLQRFLWYELPMKWLTDPAHHRRVVGSLARAFDLLELARYAAICRSGTTAEVLDAYLHSDREGKRAFLRADAASGISPPDLPELPWGSVMGWEESRALSSTAALLELAIASGELVPGARGWKARQQELVRAHLGAPRIELGGRTFLEVVQAERLQAWLDWRRSAARRRIIDRVADRLRAPPLPPAGLDDPLPPLRWLLEQLAGGQALTQTGNLNRAFVHGPPRPETTSRPGRSPHPSRARRPQGLDLGGDPRAPRRGSRGGADLPRRSLGPSVRRPAGRLGRRNEVGSIEVRSSAVSFTNTGGSRDPDRGS